MHVTPAFNFFAGEEACTRRSTSSSTSSNIRPRIVAPADKFTASAVLAAGGGTARLPVEAGSCTASSFAGAEAEAIGSEVLRRPRGIGRHRHVKVRMCAFLFLFFARTLQNLSLIHISEPTRPY